MRFVFDERKAAHCAAYLLSLHDGHMPYIKLIKLMYLADRQSFLETGYPITGAAMVSMPKGPVLSEVYDLITWGEETESVWSQLVSAPSEWEVSARREPDLKQLSEYEVSVLNEVFAEFGRWDRSALVKYTHDLPEWRDPSGSSFPIDARVILREAGRSDEEIEDVAAQVESIRSFRKLAALV